MKKVIVMILAGIMLLGCCGFAVATDATKPENVGEMKAQTFAVNLGDQVSVSTDGVVGTEENVSAFAVGATETGSVGFSVIEDYTVCDTTLVPIDDTTYNIVAPNGEVIAVYSTEPEASSRASWRYSFTVPNYGIVGSDDPVSSYVGFKMNFTMTFSSKGASQVGVWCVDDKVFYKAFDASDDFSGTITFTKDLGDVAFAVWNISGHTITYSGTLSY